MRHGDLARRPFEGPDQRPVNGVERHLPPRLRHLELVEDDPVEPGGESAERLVTPSADRVEHARHRTPEVVSGATIPLEQLGPIRLRQPLQRPGPPQRQIGHGISLSIRVTRMPSAPISLSSVMVRSTAPAGTTA